MQPAISTHVFYPHRLNPAHLDALADSGARLIEVFAARFHFDYTDRQRVKEIASWFRSHDVEAALHAPITADGHFSRHASPSLNLVSGSKTGRIEAMEEIKRALESAESIPFRSCVLHLGLAGDEWSEYVLEYALTAVEHLKAFAAPLGVRLLLENLRNEVATPEHLLEILQTGHFESAGVCLDVGHVHLSATPLHQVAEQLRARIGEVHLHDNHGFFHGPDAHGNADEHLWPATGSERPGAMLGGSIDWLETYSLLHTLPDEVPGVLEIVDLQTDSPESVTRMAREVFSHQLRLLEG